MILHIISDDKFTDYVIEQFSDPRMKSEIVCIATEPLKYSKNGDKISVIPFESSEFEKLVSRLGDYSAIVLHGLFWPYDEVFLRNVPKETKVAWMFWGGEIYSRNELENTYLAPITRFLYWLHSLKYKKTRWQLPIELYNKVNYCLTGIGEEYEYAKSYLANENIKHLWYTYYSIEETVGDLMSARTSGDNLFFCNSAAIENNMFDAIINLARHKNRSLIGNRKIIMPMGYGEPWIKNAIVKIGSFLFPNTFYPIVDFLPRKEYNELLLQCSTIILPYYFPAGQGNILTALWLGLRVYLSERSMAFLFFKRIGAVVFSLESDFPKYGITRIENWEFEQNRDVLKKWYSKKHVLEACDNVVSVLGD